MPGNPLYDPNFKPVTTIGKSEHAMRGLASDIQTEEEKRYSQGLGGLQGAYAESHNALSSLIDPDLLFSKASDAIGARSIDAMNGLRSSLGARGLNPNSGAAGGLLSRLAFSNEQALTGATRDVAIENQRQRQVNAASNFANALNLANYTQSPVSGVGLETEQNIFEGKIAQEGMKQQRKSTKSAGMTGILGGLIGAGGSILRNLVIPGSG